MTVYKFYSFDGTTTYTDKSDYVFDGDKVPVFAVNPDMKPIFSGMSIRTKADYSSDWLADGELIAVEKDGTKIYYGFVESSSYDWQSKTYNYNILNLFEKLNDVTCYTDLAANVHTNTFNGRASAFDCVSSIYSGTSVISWNDLTAKELIEHILEHSDYTGVTQTVTWSVSGDLDTVISNFCVSSLCIKNLGTDYDDEELTSVTTDPEVSVLSLLSELLKMFGLKFYWTGDKAITVYGSPTAISGTSYADADTNNYKERVRKLSELKRFVIKQNILNIEDNVDPENIHRYFTPLIYGIPIWRATNAYNDSGNLVVQLYHDHKIPSTDYTMFQDIYFKDIIQQTYLHGEDIIRTGDDKLTILDASVEQTRYIQTNLGDEFAISSLTHTYRSAYVSIVISDATSFSTPYNLIISGLYGTAELFNGTYTYESGTGNPTAAGKFKVQGDGVTIIFYTPAGEYKTYISLTNMGTAKEYRGTTGSPVYVAYVLAGYEATYNSQTDDVLLLVCGSDPSLSASDVLTVVNVSDDIDGDYTENTSTALGPGEYYNNSGLIYLYDNGQDSVPNAKIKPIFPKYQNYLNVTSEGKEDKNINFMDYLVFYRPDYSEDGDWKEDWWVIDMELTTNTTLLQAALYAPWWLYTYAQEYQTYKNEILTVEDSADTPAITYTTARRISYNVEDNSADIEQDKT